MPHIYESCCTDCGAALFPDVEHSTLTCPQCDKQYPINSEYIRTLLDDQVWAPKLQALCHSAEACWNLERVNRRVDELDAEGCEKVANYVREEWSKVTAATDEALNACSNNSDPMIKHYAESWVTLNRRMKCAIQSFSQKYEMPLI